MSESRAVTSPPSVDLRGEFLALGALAAGLVIFAIAAPGSYQLYLMIHIFAAGVWVGGGAVIAVLAFLMQRENDPVLVARFADKAGLVGFRLFLPASLVVLAFGFVLVSKGDWGYGHFWVVFALLGWIASFLVGLLFLGPEARRLAAIVSERGVEDADAQRRVRRIMLVDRTQVLVLLLVVADMAAKPFS
jgi:uncharacterized membrane protein